MKILIFNHSFFNISETFIYKQVTGLPATVELSLMGFVFMNEDIFPVDAQKFKLNKQANFLDKLLSTVYWRVTGKRPGLSVFNYFKVKAIVKQLRPDLIHVHFGFNALLIYPVAKSLNIPMVVTFHGVDASPQYLKDARYKKGIKQLLAYLKGIIVVSPHMIETLEAAQWKEKIHLIPCCVDPDEFTNDQPADNKERIKILHSGRMVSKKGVPDLVRVCAALIKKYPQVELDLIGDGPELGLCKQLAEGINNIRFHGARPHEEVRTFMSHADIFVLNSRVGDNGDMEGLPVSVLEAMSMELPVVSTRHAGIPQAITSEEDGLLVNEKDNAALATALERLINDRVLRRRLGQQARKKVKAQFTIEEMNRKILAVYNS